VTKFSDITEKEEDYWSKKEEFDWLSTKSIKSILGLVPKPKGVALELCSGSGMFTRYMDINKCSKYTCLDLSQKLLDRLKVIRKEIEIKRGDAQKLDFKEQSIDGIYIFAGLHHLPNRGACLLKSYKILKRDGKFTCFEPNADCFYRKSMMKMRNILGLYTEDETLLKPQVLAKNLEKIGFKKIRIKYITPNYRFKHVGLLYLLFIAMKIISIMPGRFFQTFFIITCEK